jgi:hypothetical protein
MAFVALTRSAKAAFTVAAAPAVVFPLLCPVREREWVDGWSADVLRSVSGVAELGCVFVARVHGDPAGTFIVTRYEPDRVIEFVVLRGDLVERLSIVVEPEAAGTRLTWTRDYTSLNLAGNAWVEANSEGAIAGRIVHLGEMLARFVDGGVGGPTNRPRKNTA